MSARNVALVRRRQLARRLRSTREAAGLSLDEAATRLDFSTSKLSRIETAQQSVDVHWVRGMMDLYGVAGAEWTELLELARAARARGWWRNYGLADRGFVPLESEASLVRDFQLMIVPGLLQTEDYARALFATALRRRSEADLENQLQVRMIRQRRLTADEPLELVAIIDEAALRRAVGGPDVMCAQLAHLVEAAELPTVTLQVLPFSAGAHPAAQAGFTLLSFGSLGEPDLAYVEHPGGATHLERPEDVAYASLLFDRLRSEALSPVASVELVEQVAMQH